MGHSLERRVLTQSAATLAVVVIIVVVALLTHIRMIGALTWVSHTHEVIAAVQEVRQTSEAMELDLRNYLRTGDPLSREEFEHRRSLSREQTARLRGLVEDSRGRLQQVEQIAAQMEQRGEYLHGIAVRRETDNGASLISELLKPAAMDAKEALENNLTSMVDSERTLLTERAAEERRAVTLGEWTLIGGACVMIVIVLMGTISIRHESMRRRSAERSLSEANANLEARVAARTAELADSNRTLLNEIAERKLAHAQLQASESRVRDLNESLERRVDERTRDLAAVNKELEEFSYSVSHDLRAPLRSIDGFSRLVMDEASDRLGDTAREHLSRVRAATQRMGQLIDDLLALARTARVELSPQDMDMSELARTICDDLQGSDPSRRVRFTIQPGLRARADPRLARVLLENLLGNAWKFTSARQDEANIEFGGTDTGRGVEMFVRDNGAGFDPEYANKLFGVFQRLHTAAEFPGSGVGLATVHRIVARHGGIVRAEGMPGRGATFYFTLTSAGDSPGSVPGANRSEAA